MANDIGPSALVWATTDETWGYVENIEVAESVEETNARNAAGDIVAANYHGKVLTLTCDYIWLTDTGNPGAQVGTGTAIAITDAIASGDWYVTNASKKKTQGDAYRQSITAKQYPDLDS